MAIEMLNRELAGVGALIIVPQTETFLTVRELTSSVRTIKEAGMRTHPMESLEPGETPQQGLKRLFVEEIKGIPEELIVGAIDLCDVFIGDKRVRNFLLAVDKPFNVQNGTMFEEVTSPQWLEIARVSEAPIGSNRFRPGVRETIDALTRFSRDQKGYRPLLYPKTVDAELVLSRLLINDNQIKSVFPSIAGLPDLGSLV